VRNLKQNTCTIAGNLVCTCCAAVTQVKQYLFAVLDNRVAALTRDIYDCTDPAAVMLTSAFI
jgi:hypothetical protein